MAASTHWGVAVRFVSVGRGGAALAYGKGRAALKFPWKGREQQRQVRERDMQEGGGPPSDWDANGRTVQLGGGLTSSRADVLRDRSSASFSGIPI